MDYLTTRQRNKLFRRSGLDPRLNWRDLFHIDWVGDFILPCYDSGAYYTTGRELIEPEFGRAITVMEEPKLFMSHLEKWLGKRCVGDGEVVKFGSYKLVVRNRGILSLADGRAGYLFSPGSVCLAR